VQDPPLDARDGAGHLTPSALTDESLLAGVAAGDAEAAAALVRRFQARAFGLALTVVGNRDTAADVAQEAFVRMWQHAAAFDPRRGTVAGWLLSIVRNVAVDVVRLRRQEPMAPQELDTLLAAVLPPVVLDDAEALGREPRIRSALRALPEEQRRAVILAVFGGCTAVQAAELDGVPLGTAKSRRRLGFSKLRTMLGADDERL
jgi:RNA polymerase sigma factor (sigma-70 family)